MTTMNRLLDDFAKAIKRNDSSFVQIVLSNGSVDANSVLSSKTKDGECPALVLAAQHGRADIVEMLLNAGARIDDVDVHNRSACMFAVMNQHEDVLQLLLAHGPNLELRSATGTALEYAVHFDRDECIVLALIEAGASLHALSRNDLCWLAARGINTLQALIDRGFIISDFRNEDGLTPLHVAAFEVFDEEVLSKLIECGVDLHVRAEADDNKTCSGCAIAIRNVDALRVFLLAGADVDSSDDDGSLLHRSVITNSVECMKLLLAAGADVTCRDRLGRTACNLLFKFIAGVRASALDLKSAMSFVYVMLTIGVDLDVEDANGKTARQWLAERRVTIDPKQVDSARREIAKMRLDFVRSRAIEVCLGLQSLRLDALQMCEILQHSCGPIARVIAFHQWWAITTTVKHFKQRV
jgi:ankyrin repeat protein